MNADKRRQAFLQKILSKKPEVISVHLRLSAVNFLTLIFFDQNFF